VSNKLGGFIYDADGQPCTVRYETVNAMLLNEFLKEHPRLRSNSRCSLETCSALALWLCRDELQHAIGPDKFFAIF
jgi:hypothetical protein